jgi:hypothetical protein
VTVTTSPADLATVIVTYAGSGSTVYASSTTPPTNAGTYSVIATLTNANYAAAPATGTLTIDKATATITLSNLTQTYDGTPKSVTVTTSPADLESGVTLSYIGTNGTTYGPTPAAPSAVGTYSVTATLSNANYAATPVTQAFTITKALGKAEYTGQWFVYQGSDASLSAKLTPLSTGTSVDWSQLQAQFTVVPAGCSTSSCPSFVFQSVQLALTADPDGSATVTTTAPAAKISEGAYLVYVDVLDSSGNYAGQRGTATLAVTPSSSTYVVGGGYLASDSESASGAPTKGYFGFNVRKQKGGAAGSMAYVYRMRLDVNSSSQNGMVRCATLGGSCKDVDVIVRSTSVTSASTTQSSTWPITGTATGKATIQFVDALNPATTYPYLPSGAYTFRFDAFDASPGPIADKYGLTVYRTTSGNGGGTFVYHAAVSETGQTGTGVATVMAEIFPVGDISAPPGNR